MGTGAGLEHANQSTPDRATQQPEDDHQQQVQYDRQVPSETNIACHRGADDDLSLGTDVEQTRPESQGHTQTSTDQRGGDGQSF